MRIDAKDLEEDRYSRFRLITWWEQDRLQNAKVLVIGAGALGNEILKNLALLGVRNIAVVDCDDIEFSNLSRSILFRPTDIGKSKAHVAAAATQAISEDVRVHAIHVNVLSGLGLGIFHWADVVIAGLDNREARLFINRSAWKAGKPWIDGAIEGINGVARVFLPGSPPCYECTLGEVDWQILEKRLSCSLLSREEMQGGKTPTTPTTASVIAGIQVQEALKLIHGLPVLGGRAFHFEGLNHSSYVTTYTENPDCMSHETFGPLTTYPGTSASTTLANLYAFARAELGGAEGTVLEFSRDIIHKLACSKCGAEEELFAPVGSIPASKGPCPADGTPRQVITIHGYSGVEGFGSRSIAELGLPPFDVFTARCTDRDIHVLIDGDKAAVLGLLAADSTGSDAG